MLEELLAYQKKDAELKEIEKKLAASEDGKKAKVARNYLKSVEENLAKLEARAAELCAVYEKSAEEQKEIASKYDDLEGALDDLDDVKAADYLTKMADGLLKEIDAMKDRISRIAEEIQSVLAEFQSIRKKSKEMQEQYRESIAKYNQLKDSLKDDRESVEKELAALAEKVEPDLLKKYKEKRAAKMYPILFEARRDERGKVYGCGHCNMELPLDAIGKLNRGEVIEHDCGCMLYLKPKQ